MIGLAGGTYSLGNYTDEEKNALSTMKMQMEDFYSAEIDADVLIYNGTIEGELTSIDELVKKNSLFADFQAVGRRGWNIPVSEEIAVSRSVRMYK